MREKPIKPKNEKKEGESYQLEDKDFLLIEAIRNLTTEIKRLNASLSRK